MKKILFLVLAMAFVLSSCGQDEIVAIPDNVEVAQVVETAEVAMEKVEEAKEAMMEESEEVADAEVMVEESEEVMEDKMEESEDVMETEAMSDDKTEGEDDSDDAMMEKEEEVMEAKTEEVAAPAVALAGSYTAYDTSLVGSTEKTVVFFGAAWCPSCVSADKNLSAASIPEGLTVLRADYDTATDLKKKYGVTSQHTFVQVDADGEMINKWSGGNSIDSIVEKL